MTTLLTAGSLSLLTVGAFAATFDRVVFEGMASGFTCLLDQDRTLKRIEVADHIAPNRRELVLKGLSDWDTKSVVADCDYEGSDYVCSWGRRESLTISMSKIHTTSTNRMQVKPVLKGSVKTGVFRPGASVSCPLVTSSRM